MLCAWWVCLSIGPSLTRILRTEFKQANRTVALTFLSHASPFLLCSFPSRAGSTSAMAGEGAHRGGGRRATRAANWTSPELRILFEHCAREPRLALGLIGSDSRSRNRRHAFFARIATAVSALGVAPRDPMATQRRFVEALKKPRDIACRLMTEGTPRAEAVEQCMRGLQHIDLLGPILRIAVSAAPSGLDSLAPVAAAMRREREAAAAAAAAAAAPASSGPALDLGHGNVPQDPAPAHDYQHSPGATMAAQEQSTTAPAPGVHRQDDAVSGALDDLSLTSTSDCGEGSRHGSQALPPHQEAMEQEERDGSPYGSAHDAAPVHPPPAPGTHGDDDDDDDDDDNMPVSVSGGDDDDDDDGDDVAIPLRPHARGPRAAAPLPRNVAGLWSQVRQSIAGAHRSTNENWTSFTAAMVTESTSLQTSINAVRSSVRRLARDAATYFTERLATARDRNALVRDHNALVREQNDLLRQLLASAPRGVARGRGRPRGRGRAGGAPVLRAGQQHVQEGSSVSEGEATVEEVALPEVRGRPQRRGRAADRSLSSPPHAAKRARRR